MSSSTTSTNTPYSGVSTSSSPTPPHDYVPVVAPVSTSGSDSAFTTKEVLIYGGGLILTAVVTYFSTLLSVNSDISTNRENISVLKSDVSHLQGDVAEAESDIAKNESVATKVSVIEARVNGLEKQLDAHLDQVDNNKSIEK